MKHIMFFALFLSLISVAPHLAAAEAFDHRFAKYNEILKANVKPLKNGIVTQIDYKKIDRKKLGEVLAQMSSVSQSSFAQFSRDQQLAFLINAYNAFTIELILQNYPLKSIRDIGSLFKPTWKIKFFTFLDEKRHLDDIEHNLIRGSGRYNEPRIHFAVNCASIGCPALLNEAFVADKLESQLELATTRFLSDRERNRYDLGSKKLIVSKIFDWYGSDFERGHGGFTSLKQFFAKYANYLTDSPLEQQAIKNQKTAIGFLDYDWNLNEVKL